MYLSVLLKYIYGITFNRWGSYLHMCCLIVWLNMYFKVDLDQDDEMQ